MKPQEYSPEYEKIKDLILRYDTRTAEKLIRKYDAFLSQQEKKNIAYMMRYHKEVPEERRKKQLQVRSDRSHAHRSYKRAMSQIKHMGKPSRQYTEIRSSIKYAKVAEAEQYLEEYDNVLSEPEKEALQYLLDRKRAMLHWAETSFFRRMVRKAAILSTILWLPWLIIAGRILPRGIKPAFEKYHPGVEMLPPIINTEYTELFIRLHFWAGICMLGILIIDVCLCKRIYGKIDGLVGAIGLYLMCLVYEIPYAFWFSQRVPLWTP